MASVALICHQFAGLSFHHRTAQLGSCHRYLRAPSVRFVTRMPPRKMKAEKEMAVRYEFPKPTKAATSLANDVIDRLDKSATPAAKAQIENYMKGAVTRGNPVPKIKTAAYGAMSDAKDICAWDIYSAAFILLVSDMLDDKHAGTLFLSDKLIKNKVIFEQENESIRDRLLLDVEALFDHGYVQNWSVCDGLSCHIIGPFVVRHPHRRKVAESVLQWSHLEFDKSTVWKRRAGHVSFVNFVRAKPSSSGKRKRSDSDSEGEGQPLEQAEPAPTTIATKPKTRRGASSASGGASSDAAPTAGAAVVAAKEAAASAAQAAAAASAAVQLPAFRTGAGGDGLFGAGFVRAVIAACDAALRSPERFAQTGGGWVMRYALLTDEKEAAAAVLRARAAGMTKEGMRYALEKCTDKAMVKSLMAIAGTGLE